jgi:hypothetical protein
VRFTKAKLGFALLFALGLSLGEAGVRRGQEAHANEWRAFMSNTSVYCEGCCPEGAVCCYLSSPCRIYLDEDN